MMDRRAAPISPPSQREPSATKLARRSRQAATTAEEHAEAELRVVLRAARWPHAGTVALRVGRVGHGGGAEPPHTEEQPAALATHHAVAEELGDQLDIAAFRRSRRRRRRTRRAAQDTGCWPSCELLESVLVGDCVAFLRSPTWAPAARLRLSSLASWLQSAFSFAGHDVDADCRSRCSPSDGNVPCGTSKPFWIRQGRCSMDAGAADQLPRH